MGYKWCVVTLCTNTSINSPNKLFVSVPTNPTRREMWLKLARRDLKSIAMHSHIFMCEDHFDMEKDIKNYMEYKMGFTQKLLVADEAVPTRFPFQVDCRKQLSDGEFSQAVFLKRQRMSHTNGDSTNHFEMNQEDNTSNTCDANSLVEPKVEMLNCSEDSLDSDVDYILFVLKEEELPDSSMHLDKADSNQQIVDMVMPIKTETVLSKEIVELQKEHQGSNNMECEHVEMVAELSVGGNVQETQTSELNMPPVVTSSSTLVLNSESGNLLRAAPSQHPRVCTPSPRPLEDEEIEESLNYGSESNESENSDDEESLDPTIMPRVIWGAMDTPLDDEIQDQQPPAPSSPATICSPDETMSPRDLFDFEWKYFPNPVPPDARREPFSPDAVGPTTPCDNGYDIFTSIWDHEIMERIATETNKYAQQFVAKKIRHNTLGPHSRICRWQDTTTSELFIYFAIILAMGVVIKSRIEEYWAADPDIFWTPGFSACMSLGRFQLLNACLHFNNNRDRSGRGLSPSEAKLFKIEPIVTHLNKKFQLLYNMDRNIVLDESLLQWKGRLNINQYIPDKAAKVGIKTYEICESRTGYLWRFEVHAHKKISPAPRDPQTPSDASTTSTPAIVLRLMDGLESKGHTLWMDDYYNSPALARRLKCLGTDVAGTLRTNRQYVPKALSDLRKEDMTPDQIVGYTSGDVDVMVWRDRGRVATISTYHGDSVAVSDGTTKPVVILDYNIAMGAVDKKDRMLAMYPIERKRTRVWYKKFFRRLLNVSVLNSYIIAKKSSSSSSRCHRSFIRRLIRDMISRHVGTSRSIARPIPQNTNIFEARAHPLAEQPFGKDKCRLRRRCCRCKKRTHFYCAGCDKPVCINACYVSLHTQ